MKKKNLFIVNVSYDKELFGQDLFIHNLIHNLEKKYYDVTLIVPQMINQIKTEQKKGFKIIRLQTKESHVAQDCNEFHKTMPNIREFYIEFCNKVQNYLKEKCNIDDVLILSGYENAYLMENLKKYCKNIFVFIHYIPHDRLLTTVFCEKSRENYLSLTPSEKRLGSIVKFLKIDQKKLINLINIVIKNHRFHKFIKIFSRNFYFYVKSISNIIRFSKKIFLPNKKYYDYIKEISPNKNFILFPWPYVSIAVKLKKKTKKKNFVKLLFMGRIVNQKGLVYLIEALSLMEKDLSYDLTLNIGGLPSKKEVKYYEYVKKASNKLKKIKLNFLGHVRGLEKRRLYESSDFLLLPSVFEPFGYVILEAVEYNLPIIYSNASGPVSILEGKGNIVLFQDSDKRTINLFNTLKNMKSMKKISLKNRKEILDKYTKKINPIKWL